MASKEFCRPDPEELLRQIQAQEADEHRGRLKIFLGYAPRVGKSLRMFDEGRRRKSAVRMSSSARFSEKARTTSRNSSASSK